jgi:exo-beta-1,3-glucanase (GH17 family)
VLLGIWLNAELSPHETCEWITEPISQEELDSNKVINQEELKRGIILANKYPEIVVAVNVGNEALVDWNDHKMHVDTVIAYCEKVGNAIVQPVTVADNYEWWAAHGKKLTAAIDFISIHVYPVWEGKDINEGLSYSIENVQKVRNALPNARIVISEAGWASVASEFGVRANEEKQERYYKEFMNWSEKMNITTFFFEAFDEDWKGNIDDPMGAEKHWGLYTVDRKPKKVMK